MLTLKFIILKFFAASVHFKLLYLNMNILKQVWRQAEIFDCEQHSQNTLIIISTAGWTAQLPTATKQAGCYLTALPSSPHSPWNTNLRAVCLVSLIISFRASSALSLVSFTKETGFCSPCFSSSSDTLQRVSLLEPCTAAQLLLQQHDS